MMQSLRIEVCRYLRTSVAYLSPVMRPRILKSVCLSVFLPLFTCPPPLPPSLYLLSPPLSPFPHPTCTYRTLLKYSPTPSTALLLLSTTQKMMERMESDPSSVRGEEIPSAYNMSTMAASICQPGRTILL